MTPFQQLGLRPDADTRSVKRAYARLLKEQRPEDDPLAFQDLHEAYQACLQEAKWREFEQRDGDAWAHHHASDPPAPSAADPSSTWPQLEVRFDQNALDQRLELEIGATGERTDDVHDGGPELHHQPLWQSGNDMPLLQAQYIPAAREDAATDDARHHWQPPALDMQAFHDGFIQQLQGTPWSMSAWLEQREELYDLNLKQQLQPVVLEWLETLPRLPSGDMLDAITVFFGMDQLSRRNPGLAERMSMLHQHSARRASFDSRIAQYRNGGYGHKAKLALHALLGEESWLMRQLLRLTPRMPRRIWNLWHELSWVDPDAANEVIPKRVRQRWLDAADPTRITLQRAKVVGLRMLVYALGLELLLRGLIAEITILFPGEHALGTLSMVAPIWLVLALIGVLRNRKLRDQQGMYLLDDGKLRQQVDDKPNAFLSAALLLIGLPLLSTAPAIGVLVLGFAGYRLYLANGS